MAIELADGDSSLARKAVVDTLTLAFAQDPIMRWIYPEPKDYLGRFPDVAAAFAGAAFTAETVWVSDGGSGAACWQPPGVQADGEAIGEALFAAIDESKNAAAEELFGRMEGFHPEEPHWYLAMIGVDSAQQGKGLGAMR